MHILIAPNAFKNSIGAAEAAEAIRRGLQASKLSCTASCFPVGDGGDGTGKLLADHLGAKLIEAEVQDPLGKNIDSFFWLTDDGKTAIIELSAASGLRLLGTHQYDPGKATTFGTGQLIRMALEKGAGRILVAIGGSATVDGGVGALRAMGVKFFDQKRELTQDLPVAIMNLTRVDLSGLDPRIFEIELVLLCDVDNPLLGEQGAAAVYGPQKGARPEMITKLEAGLAKLSAVGHELTGMDMGSLTRGGAAGGIAAGLAVFLGAKLVNGIEYFLDRTGFDEQLRQADLLITAEGRIDGQTLQGKAPFGVAIRAKAIQVPVLGLAGGVPLEADRHLEHYFDVLLSIGNEPSSGERAIERTARNLLRSATQIGNLMALFS
jgi:glycerate 2-kinase